MQRIWSREIDPPDHAKGTEDSPMYPEPKPGFQPSPQADQGAAYQHRQDGEHLQLLSVLYYVMAGLGFLGGCFSLLYLAIGLAMLSGSMGPPGNPNQKAELEMVGGIMAAVSGCLVLFLWIHAICLVLTGRNLVTNRNHLFCFVNACIICISVPFGTLLGVFTIIVLSRPSVKDRFEANRYGQLPPQY